MANEKQIEPTKTVGKLGADQFDVNAEVEDQADDGLIEIMNTGSVPVVLQLEGRTIKMKPGQKTRVRRGYALPRVGADTNADRMPSVVHCLTNGQVQTTDVKLRSLTAKH